MIIKKESRYDCRFPFTIFILWIVLTSTPCHFNSIQDNPTLAPHANNRRNDFGIPLIEHIITSGKVFFNLNQGTVFQKEDTGEDRRITIYSAEGYLGAIDKMSSSTEIWTKGCYACGDIIIRAYHPLTGYLVGIAHLGLPGSDLPSPAPHVLQLADLLTEAGLSHVQLVMLSGSGTAEKHSIANQSALTQKGINYLGILRPEELYHTERLGALSKSGFKLQVEGQDSVDLESQEVVMSLVVKWHQLGTFPNAQGFLYWKDLQKGVFGQVFDFDIIRNAALGTKKDDADPRILFSI